jgi:hypothetical protein
MKIKYFSVDVEADGPIPGEYSMVWFGAVIVEPKLDRTFEGKLQPITDQYKRDALAVSGLTRGQTLEFPWPEVTMQNFVKWVKANTAVNERPVFISDNNGFDWMFMCYYMWRFVGENPFGHSSASINWFYKGVTQNFFKSFKHLRGTIHDHNPVNDAIGNAEAFIKIAAQINFKLE